MLEQIILELEQVGNGEFIHEFATPQAQHLVVDAGAVAGFVNAEELRFNLQQSLQVFDSQTRLLEDV